MRQNNKRKRAEERQTVKGRCGHRGLKQDQSWLIRAVAGLPESFYQNQEGPSCQPITFHLAGTSRIGITYRTRQRRYQALSSPRLW
jgi:hypothetical protein